MALTDDQRLHILAAAIDMGLHGRSGLCASAALAMNKVLFGDRAEYVAAVNAPLWRRGRFAGHLALLDHGIIWDYEGTYEGDDGVDDFAEWGMVDAEDFELSEEEAEEAGVVLMSRSEVMDLMTPEQIAATHRFTDILRAAKASLGF
jgi:hypothetical protein